jgi:tRNA nucleotidyltransferase/poly(A) polymerase
MQENNLRLKIRAILEKALDNKKEILKIDFDLPDDILKIKDIFKANNFKLFVVGGAVRDLLLKKEPKDFDLATDALPDIVESMLKNKYRTIATGKAFGVINVFTPTGDFEIATFRSDIGSGRRPDSVVFTTIDKDVKRRDLTINALFYDIDRGEVVDLVGGVEDLKNMTVNTVGNPMERFSEDPLRILRFFRFLSMTQP